ncbi:MAG: alcohol dehydrogenase [Acidimicrobiaceae bacterium]|nr:alcohol dehydrogenase [Acidimicrobiaceae bacterium]
MKAVLLPGDGRVELAERPEPSAGPGEVVVRMRASAICRSDMSLYRGTPIVGGETAGGKVVPGHEAAGDVVAIGEQVEGVAVGDRVAGYLAVGCGHCRHCTSGAWMLCAQWRCMGFDFDGGDAELFVLPAGNCLVLPPEISYLGGAVLTDMVGTQFHLQREVGVGGASTAVIFGLGPMGNAGVMVGSALGAYVVAVDPLAARRERALRLGAAAALSPEEFAERRAKNWLGEGADLAVDCSGSAEGQIGALDAVRPEADVYFVGERTETTLDPSNQIIRKLTRVRGGWYFPRWRYDELAAFAVARRLPLEDLVSGTVGLEEAAEAFRAFDARETEKVVFVS